MADNTLVDGGAPNAPIGADAVTSSAVAEPAAPLDVADDTLIRVKGIDKPVKYGEHVRGFQRQFTTATQEAARLKQELAARDAKLQAFEQQRQTAGQNQQGPGQGQGDVFESLRALPYLSGADAANVVQSIAGQIQMRDRVLYAALQKMQEMNKVVSGLHESSTTASFDRKISGWLEQGGYPPEAADLAKEIYLAYEGDDLDQEFPQIFAARWKQINEAIEGARRRQVEAARRSPFTPGRGGAAGPSQPLQLKGNESPRALADSLWGQWGPTGT